MNEILIVIFSINTFAAAIRISTPIALGAMGGAFSERAGIINIGLEGMILFGAFAGAFGSFISGSPWLGVMAAIVCGGLLGGVLALFAIRFKADHIVAGVALNIFSLGATTWLMQTIWGSRGASPNVNGLSEISLPFIVNIPVVGRLFGPYSPLVYQGPYNRLLHRSWATPQLLRSLLAGLRLTSLGTYTALCAVSTWIACFLAYPSRDSAPAMLVSRFPAWSTNPVSIWLSMAMRCIRANSFSFLK